MIPDRPPQHVDIDRHDADLHDRKEHLVPESAVGIAVGVAA
jgi:hypothetical protein